MIYLDNAATTLQKPDCVASAVSYALSTLGNPSRGAHTASMAAARTIVEARQKLADLFGVEDCSRVVFAANVTAALNTAIAGLEGHIVTTAADHNSVLRPVLRRGNHTVVPCGARGTLSVESIVAAIRPDTVAVVMTHGSNLTGNVFDIAAVGAACRKRGVRFIVDAAQTAGLIPLSMKEQNISALCFTGHKSLFGPQGTGGLCLAEDFTPDPVFVGGSGSHSFDPEQPALLPERLEAGTQNAHGIAGLLAGVNYILAVGVDKLYSQVHELEARFVAGARKIPGIQLYGDLDAPVRAPVVTLNLANMAAEDLAYRLDLEYDIAVRAGAHCAPLMHQSLGTAERGAVRFSFSHLNTAEEIDTALAALRAMS